MNSRFLLFVRFPRTETKARVWAETSKAFLKRKSDGVRVGAVGAGCVCEWQWRRNASNASARTCFCLRGASIQKNPSNPLRTCLYICVWLCFYMAIFDENVRVTEKVCVQVF